MKLLITNGTLYADGLFYCYAGCPMDATIYSLADIRSQRNSATPMARIFPTQSDLAGLAQQSAVMLTSVTSFWVEYVVAMASCHVRVMSAASLPYLKPPSREAPPSNWL